MKDVNIICEDGQGAGHIYHIYSALLHGFTDPNASGGRMEWVAGGDRYKGWSPVLTSAYRIHDACTEAAQPWCAPYVTVRLRQTSHTVACFYAEPKALQAASFIAIKSLEQLWRLKYGALYSDLWDSAIASPLWSTSYKRLQRAVNRQLKREVTPADALIVDAFNIALSDTNITRKQVAVESCFHMHVILGSRKIPNLEAITKEYEAFLAQKALFSAEHISLEAENQVMDALKAFCLEGPHVNPHAIKESYERI